MGMFGPFLKQPVHQKCRDTKLFYPKSEESRCAVPKDKVGWNVVFPDYIPPDYTAPEVLNNPSADSRNPKDYVLNFNCRKVGCVDRASYCCNYSVRPNGRPMNPAGRTGMTGRGLLPRWGVNHVANIFVYKSQCNFLVTARKGIEEFPEHGISTPIPVRGDARQVATEAFLNAMVAPDEETLKEIRDFLNSDTSNDEEFPRHIYTDDARNTDNAWIETTRFVFYDRKDLLKDVVFQAEDDSIEIKWVSQDDLHKKFPSYFTFGTSLWG